MCLGVPLTTFISEIGIEKTWVKWFALSCQQMDILYELVLLLTALMSFIKISQFQYFGLTNCTLLLWWYTHVNTQTW